MAMCADKITLISFSFIRGGAAKAACRFYGIASEFSLAQCVSVEEYPRKFYRIYHLIKRLVSFSFVFFFQRKCGVKCSANFFSFWPAVFAFSDLKQLAHIHWINNDVISIFDFKKIPYASIITLHDEWLYCGVEHYFSPYQYFEKSPYFSGNNLDASNHVSFLHKFVWGVKRKAFAGRNDIIVTCPSKWLAERAKKSHVLKDCDVRVLYNPIDVSVFSALENYLLDGSRALLDLGDRLLIVFGAVGGAKNHLKGFFELDAALKLLANNDAVKDKVMLGLFGGEKKGLQELHGFPVYEFGYIRTEQEMAEVYSLAYMTIVPSRVEAFGQVAAESQSCGTPVIAFDTSGLRDVVVDGQTGFLAEAFSPESLAEKIESMILLQDSQYQRLCAGARSYVVENFSNDVVAKQYKSIIKEQILKRQEPFK